MSNEDKYTALTQEVERLKLQILRQKKLADAGVLLYSVVHEIRNPTNFIGNFARLNTEIIESDLMAVINDFSKQLPKDFSNDFSEIISILLSNNNKIINHFRRLETTIDSTLSQAPEKKLENKNFELTKLISLSHKLSYHSYMTKNKHLPVAFEQNSFAPEINLLGNPNELQRVFINLFSNAFHALMKKTKSMTAEFNPMLTVNIVLENKKEILIRIRDNGTGIKKSYINRLFEPFFTTKKAEEGTGLGLYLSKEIIEKQFGGKLLVNSSLGEYTCFEILLTPEILLGS